MNELGSVLEIPLLKPCPFCGSNNLNIAEGIVREKIPISLGESESTSNIYVWCANCGAQGPNIHHCKVVIQGWNQRT